MALQISRGVVYSVQAQDLLEGFDAFSRAEVTQLDRFHADLFDAIRALSNEEYARGLTSRYPDEIYNNQSNTSAKIVNDVETVVLMGVYRFPSNALLVELDRAAKAEATRDALDAVRFGRWRDQVLWAARHHLQCATWELHYGTTFVIVVQPLGCI